MTSCKKDHYSVWELAVREDRRKNGRKFRAMSANQIVSQIKPRKWIYFGVNNLTGRDIFVLQPKFDEKRELRHDPEVVGLQLSDRPLPVGSTATTDRCPVGQPRQRPRDPAPGQSGRADNRNQVPAPRQSGRSSPVCPALRRNKPRGIRVLFDQAGAAEIDAWLDASPQSAYARRAGHRK